MLIPEQNQFPFGLLQRNLSTHVTLVRCETVPLGVSHFKTNFFLNINMITFLGETSEKNPSIRSLRIEESCDARSGVLIQRHCNGNRKELGHWSRLGKGRGHNLYEVLVNKCERLERVSVHEKIMTVCYINVCPQLPRY